MRMLPSLSPGCTPASAFTSDDCRMILQFAADSFDAGLGAALVTLVDIRGGAARALGAHMAVRGDGLYCGYVSGGCTEAAIAAEAMEAIAKGTDRYLKIGEGSKFFDIVLPCGGGINLSIHILRDSLSIRGVIADMAARRRSGLSYDPSAQSLAHVPFSANVGWAGDCFVNAYRPRTQVLLSGQSIEFEMTANLAAAVNYDVLPVRSIAEARSIGTDYIDEDTAVALLHHDLDHELPVLRAALSARPFYIGCLGSARTHKRRSDALKAVGYDDADIARIKAPIGIFGKARDAGSLALSVLADIAAARSSGAAHS